MMRSCDRPREEIQKDSFFSRGQDGDYLPVLTDYSDLGVLESIVEDLIWQYSIGNV